MSATSTLSIVVGWGDCDPSKIVFYPNYFSWFDAGTHLLFREAGLPIDTLEERYGFLLPLTEASARFLRPSRYGQPIEIRTRIDEWQEKGFSVFHQGYRDGVLLLEGREVRVCGRRHPDDPERLQAVPVPKEFIAAFG